VHEENIKQVITNQFKNNFPNWKRITGKSKKERTKQIMRAVMDNYDYVQTMDIDIEKLIGVDNRNHRMESAVYRRWLPILKLFISITCLIWTD